MAVTNRRTIDEDFRNKTYYQNGWGIQNAQKNKETEGIKPGQPANNTYAPQTTFQNSTFNNYSEPENVANDNHTLTSRPSEDGRLGRPVTKKYRGRYESNEFVDKVSKRERELDQRYYADSQPVGQPANTNRTLKTSVWARTRGVAFGITMISCIAPLYLLWYLPITIVGAILLGLSLQVETSYLLSAIDTTAQTFGSLFGYEYFDLVGAGMLATVTVAGFGFITACILGFTAILWGLHPLSGKAAGTKTATFMVGVVGACIPFVNIFPWIIFWILVMMRHPK